MLLLVYWARFLISKLFMRLSHCPGLLFLSDNLGILFSMRFFNEGYFFHPNLLIKIQLSDKRRKSLKNDLFYSFLLIDYIEYNFAPFHNIIR